MGANDFVIPVGKSKIPRMEHDYPISERENFLRAFRHEKPKYVPCLFHASQYVYPSAYDKGFPDADHDGQDWFGVNFVYEPHQESVTPRPPYLMNDITEWREKIHWPDIKSKDWYADLPTFKRNENLALASRCLGYGIFEQLHCFEGFEQCLLDMFMETEECADFFNYLTDFKIELVKLQNDAYHFDYMCHNDDWSSAQGQMFSTEIFKECLLEPHIRIAEAVKANGCHYMLHTCGKMEAWLPIIVNDIKAELIQIQTLNDIEGIMEKYGDRVTVNFAPDPYIMYNPKTTEEQAREHARYLVDRYGAHKHKGSGLVLNLIGNKPETYYAFEDELFKYSCEKYKDL